jgi:hypothetical protein
VGSWQNGRGRLGGGWGALCRYASRTTAWCYVTGEEPTRNPHQPIEGHLEMLLLLASATIFRPMASSQSMCQCRRQSSKLALEDRVPHSSTLRAVVCHYALFSLTEPFYGIPCVPGFTYGLYPELKLILTGMPTYIRTIVQVQISTKSYIIRI